MSVVRGNAVLFSIDRVSWLRFAPSFVFQRGGCPPSSPWLASLRPTLRRDEPTLRQTLRGSQTIHSGNEAGYSCCSSRESIDIVWKSIFFRPSRRTSLNI